MATHTITITSTYDTGNTSPLTATLSLVNATNPLITPHAAPTRRSSDLSCAALVPNFTSGVVATDNCDSSVTITQSPAADWKGSGLNSHKRRISSADDWGNDSTCTATLTLVDATNTVRATCAANQWVNAN